MSISDDEFVLAKQKLDKVIMEFFSRDSILLNLCCMLDWKTSPRQNTIGVNIKCKVPCIEYNPKFVNAVSLERLELCVVGELFKVLLRHCTTRLKEPRQIAALASSITINQLMNSEIKNILAGLDEIAPSPQQFGLEQNQYYEEYYRNLLERVEAVNEKIKQIWNSLTDEQKEQMVNQAQQQMMGAQNGQGKPQEGQGDPKNGQGVPQDGQGQSQPKNDSDNDYKEYNDQKQAMKDYFDPNGNTNQGWGQNDLFDADVKNFIESKKDSAKHWGKYTGNIMSEIIAANVTTFSHKDVIKRFKKSVTTFKTIASRLKINRRYDLMFPGHRRQYTTKILFAIDVSGSMSDSDVSYGYGIVEKIFKHVEMDIVQWDTDVKVYEKNFKKKKSRYNIYGRGGTDPTCVFEYADKQKKKYDGIIVFTDSYFSGDVKEPKYKVLWLFQYKEQKNPTNFGMVSYLDRFESH